MFSYEESRALIAAGVRRGWIEFPNGHEMPSISKTVLDEQAEIRRRKEAAQGEGSGDYESE